MSNADKMFKKLKYKKNFENEYNANYEHLRGMTINFNKDDKSLSIYINYISLDELKAINEKVKELGWLE